jgi:hypothetical protein
MDAQPAATGHVLVIPKRHSPDLWHIEPEEAEKATAASVQVGRMIGERSVPTGSTSSTRPGVRPGSRSSTSTGTWWLGMSRTVLVPPWPLDQPKAEDASLRPVADKLQSAGDGGAAGRQASPQLGDRTV